MSKLCKYMKHNIDQEKILFADNKESIALSNRKLIRKIIVIAVACFAILCGMTFFLPDYYALRSTYATLFFCFTAIMFLINKLSDRGILIVFYGIFILMMVYAIYGSAILYPDYIDVFALAVLMCMPILILDNSIRIAVFELISFSVYNIVVLPKKIPELKQDEIINTIIFSMIGIAIGFFLRKIRLDNQELIRQGIIRETTDVLTGLNNRRKLFDYFIECESGTTDRTITGISILDIDHFKKYNDTYGHLAGDNCLNRVGTCLKNYGDEHDMKFYRYGGEEFVAVSYENEPEKMIRCFENIVTAVSELNIRHESSSLGSITISQGVLCLDKMPVIVSEDIKSESDASLQKEEGNHTKCYFFQKYLSMADKALYQAKENGRNQTVVYKE